MSAEVLSAQAIGREEVRPELKSVVEAGGWTPEKFGREQIQGLVRQVFLSNKGWPVRQVVFSALEPETDVKHICRQVGEALAVETMGRIVVVGEYPQISGERESSKPEISERSAKDGSAQVRRGAIRVRGNLWLVPAQETDGDRGATAWLHSYLDEMRRDFEYSIVEGPPAGESNEAMAMAQLADGIILVLSARHTRRITARKTKEMLEAAQVRILGTVLSDRVFPIPHGIYRRL
ncbi:MAG TPA: hypothetical protein VK812_17955 [Candidatus Binatus sp.]|nr:hypothetical protein [Candidatus Binatus sp.]